MQREHGSETCLAKAREKLAAEGSSTAAPNEQPRDAFAEMFSRCLALQRAHSTLKQAEQSSEQCRARAADALVRYVVSRCYTTWLSCRTIIAGARSWNQGISRYLILESLSLSPH